MEHRRNRPVGSGRHNRGRGGPASWLHHVGRRLRAAAESGMTTAEYAVGTLAAVAFAAVLLAAVRSGAVRSALTGIIVSALGSGS